MRIFEDVKAQDFKFYTLYVNTSGFAYIEFWPSRKRKYFFPNEKGYIFVFRKKLNLKRLIYHAAFPGLDLTDKVVVKIKGNRFSIFNLCALTKNQYLQARRTGQKIRRNRATGECFLLPMENRAE